MIRYLALALIALPLPTLAEQARGVLPPNVNVCFTPGENCEARIVAAILGAKHQILVQAYSFTARPIVAALIQAAARDVEVLVILDKSNDKGRQSEPLALLAANIPVWIDPAPGIAHNKVMIIDSEITITGSYNFSANARRKNAENLLVIVGRPVAVRFKANWDARLKVSRPYAQEQL